MEDEERSAVGGTVAEGREWATIDGCLGVSGEEAVGCARRFYRMGFFLLPLMWGLNCFYFFPVLRNPRSFSSSSSPSSSPIYYYVSRSAVAFSVSSFLLCGWALTFSFGGPRLFGSLWDRLVIYNLADKFGL